MFYVNRHQKLLLIIYFSHVRMLQIFGEQVQNSNLIYRNAYAWDTELSWLSFHCKGDRFVDQIIQLSLAASVYHIWRERNKRVFASWEKPAFVIPQSIIPEVQAAITSWRKKIKPTKLNWAIRISWNFDQCTFLA